MRVIYCDLGMFKLKQEVFEFNLETKSMLSLGKIRIDDLSNFIHSQCYKHKIYDVHLFGNKKYLEKIEQQILELEKEKYDKALIRIEVNK